MSVALDQAEEAFKKQEVPVGAVIADSDGKIISRAHNLKEKTHDPCGHAEILAIREAAQKVKGWRLSGMHLYVTLEPCLMCMGAIIQARLDVLHFGAYDLKGGALSLGHKFHEDPRLNHSFSIIGGLEHYQCSKILSEFFKQRREAYKRGQ